VAVLWHGHIFRRTQWVAGTKPGDDRDRGF
jgi:hypothetical protein